MTLRVGTSGWQYRDWRGPVYPVGLAQRRWLTHYAAAFATVEANSPFYRLPSEATFARWRESVPPDFVFAVKASRYLTHIRRLRDPEDPVRRLLERAAGLGSHLGPVLVQLPPTLPADPGRLRATLEAFPAGVRVAVEPRHESWHTDRCYEVLAAHDAALCWWDRLGRHGPLVRTASWAYVRFHEGRATPRPRYGTRALTTWAARVVDRFGGDADGYAYFNNDAGAAAVLDAVAFARRAATIGLGCTRAIPPAATDATAT